MKGLFIGLSTLDCIYLTTNFPCANEKIVAIDQSIVAGGPATNAAITFNYLGNHATLFSVIGNHPLSNLIKSDLATHSLQIIDLAPEIQIIPPISSIVVTQSTGERAVISINATKTQGQIEQLNSDIIEGIDLVLIDGHQMAISQVIAHKARSKNIPIVIDGGSWKEGFEEILPNVNYAICSADFYPPNCQTQEEVLTYLEEMGIPYIAISQGEKPIIYSDKGIRGKIEIPWLRVVDTLGAGDIFHGAFCHYILTNSWTTALEKSAQIASYSCKFFGTRKWMSQWIVDCTF